MADYNLCYLRKEGCAVHPDDTSAALSDKAYIKQLQAYKDGTGDDVTKVYCSRPELLDQIK